MKKEYLINDIWIVNYSVPYKDKDKLLRPFIITNIINNIVYGIPLTSFRNNRYKPNLGDTIIKNNSLTQSIIKPYQITNLKEKFFIRKVGTVSSEIVKDINQKINNNTRQYLSMKNTYSISQEFIIEDYAEKIEQQNQKIIDLELQNEQKDQKITNLEFKTEELELELKLTKNKLLLQEEVFELE